ncbi:gustatory and odorant receptor 21a-like [Frankliniella occidentalis]|uniref:Gustatory and odorant receptor 21a-like n=1 Tax=Frankliniella occidentalis TaxID=133901 RepID=A0A9C6XCG5_FRAOC|nr:gustatory and odorant receptor 21a-like [Frankliniella occidentalis]
MSISVPQYQLWRVLPIMQYNAFIMGVPALWWCLCQALAQASATLAATLVEVPVNRAAVRAHGALWVQLNDNLIALGARWGHTKYFLMLLLFVEWVIAAFTVMSEFLTNEDANFIVLLSHIALFSGSMLFISCSGAQRALDGVGRCSLRALLRLPISRMDEKVATEVALVLTSIQAASKEEVLVNGFIGYNRATLVTFLKNTATYLVVLVQFASTLA